MGHPVSLKTPRWISHSVRNKLLAMALLPLLVVLPLLVAALLIWGNAAYDDLLITKVRSDLAVARGYFGQVLGEVGSGTQAVAASHTLHLALARGDLVDLQAQLITAKKRLGFDFINLYSPKGRLLTADWNVTTTPTYDTPLTPHAAPASLAQLSAAELLALAPHLAERIDIPLIATQGAAPTLRTVEDRALVMLSTIPVLGSQGETLAFLRGGVLLNQNLALIDHINRIVYPQGSLPLRNIIKRAAKERQTSVLISSHILSEIEQLCDTVAFIDNGMIKSIENICKMSITFLQKNLENFKNMV